MDCMKKVGATSCVKCVAKRKQCHFDGKTQNPKIPRGQNRVETTSSTEAKRVQPKRTVQETTESMKAKMANEKAWNQFGSVLVDVPEYFDQVTNDRWTFAKDAIAQAKLFKAFMARVMDGFIEEAALEMAALEEKSDFDGK